ncbi:TPA: fumarylacetoacetate hydrolase family protein [Kluyvera intermedia]|uniref:5-oxopent-3-ene-1,2,5-tricarboxylate decarboxylase n=2 Tax=Enterobacteriaceae TaxID=543 RepID=A0AAC8TPI9_9ENTR|nr:fumarylacetoacetate hydrolase family protein [Phytobacter ursingii]HAT2204333.1 fumarylacetoacetate hydrolase family protein [Kluyvera intermedia]AKL14437.1 5-oxopent-3-ene-1,2,5-tricarboxylate decarboxylase [Phytobacter ursingii]HAT2517225.1 fumarylacetoacetate hydrolase family protein [Kluyvera intermedia]HAT2605226.1 fumarylacetoacetate hydrolase family protein [Kluyvera intermedia]HAT2609231.1 fumarylacetoacetate hydrolase family protein [Kluyvera intermedia]
MKIVNFKVNDKHKFGIIQGNGIIDVSAIYGNKYPTLKTFLEKEDIKGLRKISASGVDYLLDEIEFLPVIDNPTKIICVGMNYSEKRAEFNELNPEPTLFVRFADSQTGHRSFVNKPIESREFDYEGELAVIIGKTCSHVNEAKALDYVAGYSCYMDGSARDWQHTWYTAGKNWPRSGAFGPWLTCKDEITDPHNLSIRTFLNSNEVQNDNTRNMVHKIPYLISYISTFTKLNAGDVIITGSPGGVGKKRNPPLFLKDGDFIEVEIEGVGRLSNHIKEAVAL